MDAVGPFRTQTLGGKRYALFITDSYSTYHVCCLLRTKDEQPACLEKWIKWSYAQTGNRLRWVRADREWTSGAVKELQKKYGFELKLTTRDSPKSNGLAERSGGILVEKARVQLIQSGFSPRFFGESLMTATYIKNRLPTQKKNHKNMISAYALFYGFAGPIHQFAFSDVLPTFA